MARHGNKERRTILLPPEMDEYVAKTAQDSFRSYSEQLTMLLSVGRNYMDAAGTQLDTEALRDSSLLEKVR